MWSHIAVPSQKHSRSSKRPFRCLHHLYYMHLQGGSYGTLSFTISELFLHGFILPELRRDRDFPPNPFLYFSSFTPSVTRKQNIIIINYTPTFKLHLYLCMGISVFSASHLRTWQCLIFSAGLRSYSIPVNKAPPVKKAIKCHWAQWNYYSVNRKIPGKQSRILWNILFFPLLHLFLSFVVLLMQATF